MSKMHSFTKKVCLITINDCEQQIYGKTLRFIICDERKSCAFKKYLVTHMDYAQSSNWYLTITMHLIYWQLEVIC